MRKVINSKVTIYGTAKEVAAAEAAITPENWARIGLTGENDARLSIAAAIDVNKLSASILYKGNTVYGSWKLIPAFKRMVKAGGPVFLFTNDLYKFFSLACGSIAHYNAAGWANTYPTTDDLRRFFGCNEYGRPVASYPLGVDGVLVATEMAKILGV
jgi:hypothetical protein